MGTNFYIRGHRKDEYKYDYHIGKRSAAGWYCWDCGVTLCKGGNSKIHFTHSDNDWFDRCPSCSQEKSEEELSNSSGGRELGFNKQTFTKKTGVKSCSSFSWGIQPDELKSKIEHVTNCPICGQSFLDPDKVIENEYGDLFTLDEFEKMLEECPVQFFDLVGQSFE